MNPADALKIARRLLAAFPQATLDEPQTSLFISEIALLANTTVANAATDRIVRTSDRFPTIAEFRAQYRANNEAARRPALPPETGRDGIPEWIHVWFWQMQRTRTERQAAREGTRRPVDERAPVKMRDFPQYDHPGPDAYSLDEYETIRSDWAEADSPTVGSVAEILGAI